MTKKSKLRPILIAVGAGVALSLASLPMAQAGSSNFSAEKLSSGYQLAGTQTDTTNGNGMDKAKDGKCGNGMDKAKDGKCGNGKTNGDNGKNGDGKCGTGKCGTSNSGS